VAIGIIKGHDALNTQGGSRMGLRKVLIVFQFVLAQVFIAGALIMGVQLSYTLKKDLGFNKEAVVLLDVPWKVQRNPACKDKHFVLAEVLKNETGIAMVSVGGEPLADNTSSSMYEYYSGKQQEPVRRQVYKKWVDTSYIHVYNMQLLAGRNLRLSDTTNEFLINETAAKAFGFASPQDAVGKTIGQLFGLQFPIVGVVKDFHVRDFHTTFDPVALMANKEGADNISIRLSGNNPAKWRATLKKVERKWHQMYPSEEWNGRFYDQTLAAMYKQERDQSKLVNLSTAIAIVISSLGLFGMALLIAFQRTKEIGIRKVLAG
jgi:putative ABC transport system permease protein